MHGVLGGADEGGERRVDRRAHGAEQVDGAELREKFEGGALVAVEESLRRHPLVASVHPASVSVRSRRSQPCDQRASGTSSRLRE